MSKKSVPAREALILYADSNRSADQLYLGGFSVPDPFISFKLGRRSYAVVNQLEFSRALKESKFSEVLPLEDWMEKAREVFDTPWPSPAQVIAVLAKAFGIARFYAPADFPAGVALELISLGLPFEAVKGSCFPERESKTEQEIAAIREGNRCSATGIRAAEKTLKKASLKNGYIIFEGKKLTSERLREKIEVACLEVGSLSLDTIVAGGEQACDPHCVGFGPLRANELIIVDVFPRVSKTGYFGDMTRTFLKGKASDAQKALVKTVRDAQKLAISKVRAGVNGKTIHNAVLKHFENTGYKTERTPTGSIGFFHGTGHGLGLEVHESPRISVVSQRLKKNSVVTVEPGLYYPGLGGCRIEDVVVARSDGAEKISKYGYKWIVD